jgi:hypothetical protein
MRGSQMNVADLLGRAGGKAATDLQAMANGLAPLAAESVKDFAEFLARADEYRRTGIVPVKKPKGGSTTKPPRTPKPDPDTVAAAVKDLYERAVRGDPTLTQDEATGTLAQLDGLTAPGLTKCIAALGLPAGLKSKKKPDLLKVLKETVQKVIDIQHRVEQ